MEKNDEIRMPASDDTALEGAVLSQLLALHPVQLTHAELVRELAGNEAGFEQSDAVERAVRDLTGAGLLHCPNAVVMPTNAAFCFAALSEDDPD